MLDKTKSQAGFISNVVRLTSVGVTATLLGTIGITDYYLVRDEMVHGRQLWELTTHELDVTVNKMKDTLDARQFQLSLNEQFAWEDAVNYICRDNGGIRFTNRSHILTKDEVKAILDDSSNCNL